jgi:cell division septum initiation protein DivIVA
MSQDTSRDRAAQGGTPQGMTPTDVLDVLEELAALIENARPLLMSSDVRVDRDQALGLVDELRGGLPGAIEQADAVHAQATAELEEARRSSEETIVQARQRAMELVEQEQVVAQAKARAAEIVAEAQEQAARLRADADDYCDRRLADFEGDLGRLVAQVRAGRAKLAERLASAPVERPRPESA